MNRYAIRFDFPESAPVFAGRYKDGLGWASTLKTAILFDHGWEADQLLRNGYGEGTRPYGTVVKVKRP